KQKRRALLIDSWGCVRRIRSGFCLGTARLEGLSAKEPLALGYNQVLQKTDSQLNWRRAGCSIQLQRVSKPKSTVWPTARKHSCTDSWLLASRRREFAFAFPEFVLQLRK